MLESGLMISLESVAALAVAAFTVVAEDGGVHHSFTVWMSAEVVATSYLVHTTKESGILHLTEVVAADLPYALLVVD